ncbi:MAG: phosphatidylinositol transfer protein [Deltaproteobacteria bacterium]|nr:phosphatidylinositol transfer protein [Deltaproteobacteria bacterium]
MRIFPLLLAGGLAACTSASPTDEPDGGGGAGGTSSSGSTGLASSGTGSSSGAAVGSSAGTSASSGGSPTSLASGSSAASSGSSAASAGSSAATGSSAGAASGASLPGCLPAPACDAAPPDPGAAAAWRHDIASPIIVATGSPNHRGRDLLLNPGDPQWVIAKFAYGLTDKDLKDEDVDLYLLRSCAGAWEALGTATTTSDNTHAPVEGVEDSGGRVYFQIPADKTLGTGRHRVHLVVRGDLSTTDALIDVLPPGTATVVSDVDGTLTTSENEEFTAMLTGATPNANPSAPEVLSLLAGRGWRVMYVTARPEFLVGRTREFVRERGFPPGPVHTTLTLTGGTGGTAVTYKTGELATLAARGLLPGLVFGNTVTDAEAYGQDYTGVTIPAEHRYFFQYTDGAFGGTRVDNYADLLTPLGALPAPCR